MPRVGHQLAKFDAEAAIPYGVTAEPNDTGPVPG